MFDKARERVANRILPVKAAAPKNMYNVFSQRTPNVPVYTDLTIRKATREGYKLSLYVYRAVRTIVQSASGIPWIVLDKDGEEIPNHPFTEAWANPNPFFSGQDNMEYLIAHLKLVGNAMIQPIMVGGQPKEFWVCMPDLIHPVPSKDPAKWIDGYQVTEADGAVRQQLAPPETFIHFMQFNPGDPYWGIGDLQAAARTVDTDNEMQDTQKVSMQNRGTPDGVFVSDVAMTTEQWEEAQRQVKEKYTNKKSRREPWILGAGYKWYQMSLTPVEMDYIESRLRNLDDIATAFGLDPWWLGDRRASTYNNLIEAKKALYELVAIPLLDDIKATLNLKLAPLYGDGITITYDLSGVTALREDFGQKVTQAKTLFDMGVPISQSNDVLKLGLQEFPGWENSYLPFSLAPVGYSVPASMEETEKSTHGCKMLNMSDEQKAAHWRRVDTRRSAWWPIAEKKLKPVYASMAADVNKAVAGKEPSQMASSAVKAIEDSKPKFEKVLTAVVTAVAEDFGKETLDTLKPKSAPKTGERKVLSMDTPAMQQWMTSHIATSVKSILETEIVGVKGIIEKGIADGLGSRDIYSLLTPYFDEGEKWKAMRVARTEVGAAAGEGQREAAAQSGYVTKKQFIATMDDRVRDSHANMNNEIRRFDEVYSNGQMYPGDTSTGNPADFINCRCAEGYIV
ncbi:MAG: phage portal protein [Sphaerochaeta sp.]|jgi:HK97 family phage portal protein|nr:phage portal protein [Sphaerochaeta sp.]